ncbi:MAG: PorT family protein [Bacteroidales bacterium]|jgi:hypothetical protein|nr:PorT family protein [Bacteroidales bacterium]
MKKTIICYLAAMPLMLVAQPAQRNGNMETTVKKSHGDTLTQITLDKPCPCEKKHASKPAYHRYSHDATFAVGFILPDDGAGMYTIDGIKSYHLDFGWGHRYQMNRVFTLGSIYSYSFHNYRLKDAASDPLFTGNITGGSVLPEEVKKQTFRSHNISVNVYLRLYVIPQSKVFIDLGVQGDMLFNKYYKVKYNERNGMERFHENHAFRPFTASAVARIGKRSHISQKDFSFFARYRFTEIFNGNVLMKDLPPLSIGIQLQ